jgi:hypothetical protein
MVLNYTFNYISVILWRSVLLVEVTRVPGEKNHRSAVYCFSQDTPDTEKVFYLTEYLTVYIYTIIDFICIAISHQRQVLRCEM